MSISSVYLSGGHKKNMGHFASIVKLAIADEIITDGEQQLLDRLAKRLHISEEDYKKIFKNPEEYPINPPVSYDERIERLYNLTKMIYADKEVSKEEVSVLKRIVVGLGFPQDNAEKVSDEAVHLVMNDNDLEDFTKAIKRVNSI
ncbi:MAG: TerB family tellurite resistance protein [Flavobacteriaceae bacterium]|nr:TerB family tellurite resistance protein [Flavobacteriaceae bacterium]